MPERGEVAGLERVEGAGYRNLGRAVPDQHETFGLVWHSLSAMGRQEARLSMPS